MGQKWVFPKMILHHLGCLNKRNERILSPLQAILAPPKSANALKMGSFATKNGSKMGQKWSKVCFSNYDPTPFGVPKQEKLALFEPIASHWGHSKVTKCIENGLFFGTKNQSKMDQNVFFQRYLWTIWGAQTSGMSPF